MSGAHQVEQVQIVLQFGQGFGKTHTKFHGNQVKKGDGQQHKPNKGKRQRELPICQQAHNRRDEEEEQGNQDGRDVLQPTGELQTQLGPPNGRK